MYVWQRPFALVPTFAGRPWGVTDLSPWFDGPGGGQRIGEAWFTADGNATSLGTTFGELTRTYPEEILGPGQGVECPLLVKILFTSERLSVQVHPDDAYAAEHHQGSRGKTEAWHILSAEPHATIGLGLSAPLTRAQGEAAALSGDIEHLMDWRPVEAGETYLVPAGTVHALGPGLTLVEVQEQSDITYRLYDYGRGRELHLEHGFAVADLSPYARPDIPQTHATDGRTVLTRCRYFTMERRTVTAETPLTWRADRPSHAHVHLVVALSGSGRIAGEALEPGGVWCVPAKSDAFTIESDATCEVLVTYPSETETTALV